MNKTEIIEFLECHPGWVLQYCRDIRDNGWWWLRETPVSGEVIMVNGNSAHAAVKQLVLDKSNQDWRTCTYRLQYIVEKGKQQ